MCLLRNRRAIRSYHFYELVRIISHTKHTKPVRNMEGQTLPSRLTKGAMPNSTEFKMTVIMMMMISHSKIFSAKPYHKCAQVVTQSVRYFCQIVMNIKFSRQIFDKLSSTKCHAKLYADRRTERKT